MEETHARVIAVAVARTGLHHRRNGIAAGVAALLGCGLTIYVDFPSQKAVSLAVTILCAIASYTSIRLANRYVDPSASPVLDALARDPSAIVAVSADKRPPSLLARLTGGLLGDGKESYVAVEHHGGARLLLRIEPGPDEEVAAEVDALLDAFSAIAPKARIERRVR